MDVAKRFEWIMADAGYRRKLLERPGLYFVADPVFGVTCFAVDGGVVPRPGDLVYLRDDGEPQRVAAVHHKVVELGDAPDRPDVTRLLTVVEVAR